MAEFVELEDGVFVVEEGSGNEEDFTTFGEVIHEIEMEKNCPKEDLRKKYHREWEAYVEDFREKLFPGDKAYLLMEEKKSEKENEVDTTEIEKKEAEKETKTEEVEQKKDEKEMKTEEVEEKKSHNDWKAKNAKRPVIDID